MKERQKVNQAIPLTPEKFELSDDELVIEISEVKKSLENEESDYQSPTRLRRRCVGGGGATVV